MVEITFVENLLEDGVSFLSSVFEQGLLSAGSRGEEARQLAFRYQEAGLGEGSAQFEALAAALIRSRLAKEGDQDAAVQAYCFLWPYLKACQKGLELYRAQRYLEETTM